MTRDDLRKIKEECKRFIEIIEEAEISYNQKYDKYVEYCKEHGFHVPKRSNYIPYQSKKSAMVKREALSLRERLLKIK